MKVVNCRKVPSDFNTICIDRTTIFGNPFRMKIDSEDERLRVIDEFKIWFEKKVECDLEFRKKVLELRGHDLACWCSPKPCHGEVIIAWLNKHQT